MWKEFVVTTADVETILRIIWESIDDGYEWKVEDHKLWYR